MPRTASLASPQRTRPRRIADCYVLLARRLWTFTQSWAAPGFYASIGMVAELVVPPKPVEWVGSSLRDLRDFPDEVKQAIGFAIYQAQTGGKHVAAKPLKGFRGAGVLEVVEDYDGDTYRTVYTVRFSRAIYVLHAFQKKSRKGAKTPKHEMDLVEQRLKAAEKSYLEKYGP